MLRACAVPDVCTVRLRQRGDRSGEAKLRGIRRYHTLNSLDGSCVTITGYMATLSPLDGRYMYLMNMPYQSCPFCVPNTCRLSNTMAVFVAGDTKFEFADCQMKITGALKVE